MRRDTNETADFGLNDHSLFWAKPTRLVKQGLLEATRGNILFQRFNFRSGLNSVSKFLSP
jgi:hypothetical protein